MRRIAEQYVAVLRGVSDGSLPWRDLAEGEYLNETAPGGEPAPGD
jgi:hypothetical protein